MRMTLSWTLLSRFLTALQWRGLGRAGDGFRTLMDALQIDDAAWCFRTGPSGRIELRKTIKAVESGYDCDILETVSKQDSDQARLLVQSHEQRFYEHMAKHSHDST